MLLVRRSAATLGVCLVLAILAGTAYGLLATRRSLPVTDGVVEVDGVIGEARIRRDAHAAAYVDAEHAHDLWFAQGYVHAQDRFWQMDIRRRHAAGRLAEWFGAPFVDADVLARTLGWRRMADEDFELLDEPARAMLTSYADGVNAWLDGRGPSRRSLEHALLPLDGPWRHQPEAWTPQDSLAVIRAHAWELSGFEDTLVRARLSATDLGPDRNWRSLYPPVPAAHPPVIVDGGTPTDDGWSPAATHGRDEYPLDPDIAIGDADLPGDDPDDTANDAADEADGDTGDEADDAADEADGDTDDPDGEAAGSEAADAASALAQAHDRVVGATVLAGRGAALGSHAWVVDADHAASGAPMLVNDIHLAPSLPSAWHQVGLRCSPSTDACPYAVTGMSLPGVPGVWIGRTDTAAWGMVNLHAPTVDVVIERVVGDQHQLDGQWLPMELRDETIVVAGGDDITWSVRSTGNGPVLSDVTEPAAELAAGRLGDRSGRQAQGHRHAVSVRWTGHASVRTAEALEQLARLDGWDGFRHAADRLDLPAAHMVYAGVDGDIGYITSGRLPVRRDGDGWLAVTGWTSDEAWVGELPADQRPWVYQPPSGVLIAANQPILPPRDRPELDRQPDIGFRAARIDSLLDTDDPVNGVVAESIQHDVVDTTAPPIVELLVSADVDETEAARVQAVLADWDLRQSPDSPGAAAYNVAWRILLERTFHDELPSWAHPDGSGRWAVVVADLARDPQSPWWDDLTSLETHTRDDVVAATLVEAHRELASTFGPDTASWHWGGLQHLRLEDRLRLQGRSGPFDRLFDRGSIAPGGSTDTVWTNAWDAGSGYEVTNSPVARIIIDLGDVDGSRWAQLTGQWGHPFASHYTGQLDRWRDGGTSSMPFSPEGIDARTVATMHLREPVEEPDAD